MVRIKNIVCFLIIFLSVSTRAEIYSAESVEEINNSIMEMLAKINPSKTLLLVPLEGFLVQPMDKEFFVTDKKYTPILHRAEKRAKLSRKAYLEELVLTKYENELVDPYLVEFFQNIQEKNVPMLVYTANCSGSLNEIPYLEVWTWTYLLNSGIDLSKSPIGEKQFIFNKYHKKVKYTYPTYYKGLLSANSWERENSIQSVLATLFAIKLKTLPDVVYIVNKDERFIRSVEQQFKALRRDIQIEGFVFSPKKKHANDLSIKQVYDFWTKLVNKLNKISRKEVDKNTEDPYEQ